MGGRGRVTQSSTKFWAWEEMFHWSKQCTYRTTKIEGKRVQKAEFGAKLILQVVEHK
jgi:hypothetical protein